MSDTLNRSQEERRFDEAVDMLSRVLAHAKLGLLATEVERVLARCRAVQALRQPPEAATTVPACPGSCCDCGRGCAVAPTAAATVQTAKPATPGVYAWQEGNSFSLVLVNRRPSEHSPGGVLNGHILKSNTFYDGCAISDWNLGRWVLLHEFAEAPRPQVSAALREASDGR